MLAFLKKYWFLLGLTLAVLLGVLAHQPLRPLGEQAWLRNGIVFLVLYLMLLPLHAETILGVVRRPLPALLASAINLGLLPPLAWLTCGLLPPHLARGLIVAAATPCTVASAAVWTRKAGGNDAVAVMVTVMTNLSCFVVTPFWVWSLTGGGTATISLSSLIGKLALFVLLPMLLAQLSRGYRPLAEAADRRKATLSSLAQIGILSMVFIGSIRTGEHLGQGGGDETGAAWMVMIGLVTGLHLAGYASGWWAASGLGIAREEKIAVAFSGSQKTLLVGLSVALETEASILPMVTYHLSQLFVDTFLADRLQATQPSREPAERPTSQNEGGRQGSKSQDEPPAEPPRGE